MFPSILQLSTRRSIGALASRQTRQSSYLKSTYGRKSPSKCTMQIVQHFRNRRPQPSALVWFLCKRGCLQGEIRALVRASGNTGPSSTKARAKASCHPSIVLGLAPVTHPWYWGKHGGRRWRRCRSLSGAPAIDVARLGTSPRTAPRSSKMARNATVVPTPPEPPQTTYPAK